MTNILTASKQTAQTISLKKYGAIAAIAFPILLMVAQGFMQAGGLEPSFAAPGEEILSFFQSRDVTLFTIGGYISMLAPVAFLWFLGSLWDELRTAEGGSGWLSLIAVGSGLAAASSMLGLGDWYLAVFRVGEGLTPEMARLFFDQSNFNFAQIWIAFGSMVFAVGIIISRTNRYPLWLGWASIILAIALFLARAVWTLGIAFIPYLLFWLWMITIGVMMLRRNRGNIAV